MKGLKTFYLDMEILQELKKIKNPSLLVNSYFKNYFSIPEITDKADAQAKADEAREIAAILDAKVEEIEKAEPEVKELKTWD
jgi:hypothetical protein